MRGAARSGAALLLEEQLGADRHGPASQPLLLGVDLLGPVRQPPLVGLRQSALARLKLAQSDGLKARCEGEAHAVGWRQRGRHEHQQQIARDGALKRQLAWREGRNRRRDCESEEQHTDEANTVGGRDAEAEALPDRTALEPAVAVQEPEPEEGYCKGDACPDRALTLRSTPLRPTVEGCEQRK